MTIVAEGSVVESDLLGLAQSVYEDPLFHPDYRVFYDCSGIAEWNVPDEITKGLASRRKFSANSRTAVWAAGPLFFGLGRMYEAYVTNGQVKVFRTRADAVTWLNEGLPPELGLT